jgi:hypothetical protein
MKPSQSALPKAQRVDHSLCGLRILIFKSVHCGTGCGKHANPAQSGPRPPLSLPSSRWLLTILHHPLHHVLHPNRRLTGVLLLRPSQLPRFALVSATLIGWYKPLLRPLTLRSMKPRGLELMSWCLSPWCLIGCLMPRSLMLSCRCNAILSLSRHFFLGFGLLCFQEGALRLYMPTETAVMANRRSSDGMRLLSA